MLRSTKRCARGGWSFHPFTALTILVILVTWRLHPTAWANGGTPQLTAVRAGPYLVSAWTQPDSPRAGALDISVAVMRPESKRPVLDAEVHLTAARIEGEGSPLAGVAIRGAGANKLLYHANLELPGEGRWRVSVLVTGLLGTGSAAFTLDVEPPTRVNWPRTGGLLILVVAGLMWGMLHLRRSRLKE